MSLRTCLKCGHSAEASTDPAASCPACGAIYAKVEQIPIGQRQALRAAVTAERRPAAPTASSPPRPSRLLWIFAAICTLFGLLQLGYTFVAAESAPQQAAGAALAAALAVVPYVLARADQELRK